MKRKNVHHFLLLLVLFMCSIALLSCSYTGSLASDGPSVESEDANPIIAPYSAEEIEAESLDLDSRGTIPSSVSFSWRPGQKTGDSPYFTIKETPAGKLWVEMNYRPDGYTHYRRAQIYVTYTDNPDGWMVNIGDSKTNNGYAGDGSTQSNDAELQVYNRCYRLYASDYGKSALLKNVSNFTPATGNKWMRFYVANGYTSYYSSTTSGSHSSSNIFALNGQADGEGKTNFTMYAGFNRVVANTSRVGKGINYVTVKLYDPVPMKRWSKSAVAGETIYNILQRHGQDYILAGKKDGIMMVKRVTETGYTQWTKKLTYKGSISHVIHDTENYNYIACGLTDNRNQLMLFHFNQYGGIIRSKLITLNFNGYYVNDMITTSRNEIIVLVYNTFYRLDANFNILSKKQFPSITTTTTTPTGPGIPTDPGIPTGPGLPQLRSAASSYDDMIKNPDGIIDIPTYPTKYTVTKSYHLNSVIEEGSDFIIVGSERPSPCPRFADKAVFIQMDRYGNVKKKLIDGFGAYSKVFNTKYEYLVVGYRGGGHAPPFFNVNRVRTDGTHLWQNSTGLAFRYNDLGESNKFRDGFVLCGWDYSQPISCIALYDKSGKQTLQKAFSNVWLTSVIATGDGGIAAITETGFMKLDQNGN